MEHIAIIDIPQNIPYVLTKIQAGDMFSVTSESREIAKLVPPDYSFHATGKKPENLRKTAFVGDIVSSVGEKWEALI
ncbi:MAG: hypothetical protein AB7S75_10495 [Desulfococcaceae bacterium]